MGVSNRASQVVVVGQKIRQIRKSRRLTQADLAARIGVTQSDLSRMENGEYKVGLDTLFRILQVFDLSMGRFFEEPLPDSAEPDEVSPADPSSETRRLVADYEDLDEDFRREVREFIAFKRTLQEGRQPRWKPDAEGPEAVPSALPDEAPIPFGRPGAPAKSE